MFKRIITSLPLLLLMACANHQPTKAAMMSMPGFMNKEDTIEQQRPPLPKTHFIRWENGDRLQDSVVLDYVSGMSQRDYLFEEPNQELYRPMLLRALAKSGLQARTPASARYALQIEFLKLDTDAFGRHFAGRTDAIYRIVDRQTGQAVYESEIGSRFIAAYPGLNEQDASFAYDVSAPGVISATQAFGAFALYEGGLVEVWNNNQKLQNFFGGEPIAEVSQAGWNDTYQAYAWVTGLSAISGPTLVGLGQLNPLNYISMQLEPRREQADLLPARRGELSERAMGSRSARKRANQLNSHLLAQSITYFLMDLAEAEDKKLLRMVSCKDVGSSTEDIIAAIRNREQVISDDCTQYMKGWRSLGVGITQYQ